MKHTIKFELATTFHDLFKRTYIDNWKQNPESFPSYIETHLRFLTFTTGNPNPDAALPDFRRAYRQLLRDSMGNHFRRRKAYQPVTIAFVDYAGSRTGNIGAKELPHVHAMMLPHPNYAKTVAALVGTSKVLVGSEVFDPKKGRLLDLITYCMKGAIRPDGSETADWAVFP